MKATIDLSEYRLYDKNIPHHINAMTATVAREENWIKKSSIIQAFNEIPENKRGDTFYCAVVDTTQEKFFIEYNGHGGYTLLRPEEH